MSHIFRSAEDYRDHLPCAECEPLRCTCQAVVGLPHLKECAIYGYVQPAGPEDGIPAKDVQAMQILPTDKTLRKEMPIARGFLDYFPNAVAEVARVSYLATQQHHPGQEMHWDRGKSSDHADCIGRHLIERGKVDDDGIRHSAKLAWRAMALLQLEIEAEKRK